jgi:hypothetical protein
MAMENWRFRLDDGDVDNVPGSGGASWIADLDTAISLPINAPNWRLRAGVKFKNDNDSGFIGVIINYKFVGDPGWIAIRHRGHSTSVRMHSAPSSINPDNMFEHQRDMVDSYTGTGLPLWDGTWQTDDNGASGAGGLSANSGRSESITWTGDNTVHGLAYEFCVQFEPSGLAARVGEDIEFRYQQASGPAFGGYAGQDAYPAALPTITLLDPVAGYDQYLPAVKRTPFVRILGR